MKLNKLFVIGACSVGFFACLSCTNNDQAVLNKVNKVLKENADKIHTCHDAIVVAEENNIELNDHKFVKPEYEFAYDSKAKQFVIMNGDNIVKTSAGYTKSENTLDYFKSVYVYNPNSKYSQYLDKRAAVPEQLLITTGFDIGDHIDIPNIAYTNLSNTPHDVIVRTYSDYFSILAPLDTIHHYEIATNVIVTSVATLDMHATTAYVKAYEGYINFTKDSETDFFECVEGAEEDVSIDIEDGATFAATINIKKTKSGKDISSICLPVTNVSNKDEFDSAINDGESVFIRLTHDIDNPNKFNLARTLCLDLAGYKISFDNSTAGTLAAITVTQGNSLYILDSQGVLDNNSGIDLNDCYISVNGGEGEANTATLMINGGKITQTVTDDIYLSAAVACVGNYLSGENPHISNFSMYGGKIEARMEGTATSATCVSSYGKGANVEIVYGNFVSDANCIACNVEAGSYDLGGSNLSISGGHFVSGKKIRAACIEYGSDLNLNINGGTFTGATCVAMASGTAHISNATLTANGQYRVYPYAADGSIINILNGGAKLDMDIENVIAYSNFAYILSGEGNVAEANIHFLTGSYSYYLDKFKINEKDKINVTIDNQDDFTQHDL